MALKFAIKSVAGPSQKEGDDYVRFTGNNEVFRQSSERRCQTLGYVGFGPTREPIVKFTTGLDDVSLEFLPWLNDEEVKEVKKIIADNKERIANYYGGELMIKDDNKDFWLSDRAWGRLRIDNYNMDVVKSTKDPKDCLLYLSIIAGAFIDLVAPSKDYAERDTNIPFYLALEEDAVSSDSEEYVSKLDAQAALSELSKQSGDGMFVLAWCLQYDSTSFGAFSRIMTSKADLIKYHSQFIDGKILAKKNTKRNAPKMFLDYFNLWKSTQTRSKVLVEAYIKAGEYYSLINKGKKQYQTKEGTVLGNSLQEAIDTLMKPANADELDRLRDAVEKKWNE